MILYVWLLTCTMAGAKQDCSTFQLYQTQSLTDCWEHAQIYLDVLSQGPSQNYRIWCAGPDEMEIAK